MLPVFRPCLLLIALQVHLCLSSSASILFGSSGEDAAVDKLPSLQLTSEESGAALEEAMSLGWWKASASIISYAAERGQDVVAAYTRKASSIKASLSSLAALLRIAPESSPAAPPPSAPPMTAGNVPPAFEWAQSPYALFLNVKFSHKLDTPATLGCETEDISYERQRLVYKARCKSKNFVLDLGLASPIDPTNCSVALASVGRAMITLAKETPGPWPRLTEAALKHGHVWWTMKEKYDHENANFGKEPSPAATPTPTTTTATAAAAETNDSPGASNTTSASVSEEAVRVSTDGESSSADGA